MHHAQAHYKLTDKHGTEIQHAPTAHTICIQHIHTQHGYNTYTQHAYNTYTTCRHWQNNTNIHPLIIVLFLLMWSLLAEGTQQRGHPYLFEPLREFTRLSTTLIQKGIGSHRPLRLRGAMLNIYYTESWLCVNCSCDKSALLNRFYIRKAIHTFTISTVFNFLGFLPAFQEMCVVLFGAIYFLYYDRLSFVARQT